jgi:hypothetical protein
MEKRPT